LLSGDDTDYGANVAKITKMTNCKRRQNWGKGRQKDDKIIQYCDDDVHFSKR